MTLEYTSGTVYKAACSIFSGFCPIHERLVSNLLFADAAAMVTHKEQALQCITSCFTEAVQLFGLEVNLKKTDVLYQPAPCEAYHPPCIFIGDTELKFVQHFTYLGCTIFIQCLDFQGNQQQAHKG